MNSGYYDDTKWCPECSEYVRYISSIDVSYCSACSGRVRIFSPADSKVFTAGVQEAQKEVQKKSRRRKIS